MSEIFYSYISYFLHPFKVNTYFQKRRTDYYGRGVPFLVDATIPMETDLLELDLSENLVVSWILFIIHSFYSILFINVSYFLAASFDIGEFLNPKILIYTTLIQVIFFPLVFYAYAKLWSLIVEFFGRLFYEGEDDISEMANQVVGVSLTSHIFLVIPVIGAAIRHIAFLIFLFAGLRNNLGFSTVKSFMVILSPLFILGLMVFMFALLVATIFVGF